MTGGTEFQEAAEAPQKSEEIKESPEKQEESKASPEKSPEIKETQASPEKTPETKEVQASPEKPPETKEVQASLEKQAEVVKAAEELRVIVENPEVKVEQGDIQPAEDLQTAFMEAVPAKEEVSATPITLPKEDPDEIKDPADEVSSPPSDGSPEPVSIDLEGGGSINPNQARGTADQAWQGQSTDGEADATGLGDDNSGSMMGDPEGESGGSGDKSGEMGGSGDSADSSPDQTQATAPTEEVEASKDLEKTFSDFMNELARGGVPVDMSSLVQDLLHDSYLDQHEDLTFYADKEKFFNAQKQAVRDYLTELSDQVNQLPEGEDLVIPVPTTEAAEDGSQVELESSISLSMEDIDGLLKTLEGSLLVGETPAAGAVQEVAAIAAVPEITLAGSGEAGSITIGEASAAEVPEASGARSAESQKLPEEMVVERESDEPKLVITDPDGDGGKFNPDDVYEQAGDLREPNQITGQYGNEGDPAKGDVDYQGDPSRAAEGTTSQDGLENLSTTLTGATITVGSVEAAAMDIPESEDPTPVDESSNNTGEVVQVGSVVMDTIAGIDALSNLGEEGSQETNETTDSELEDYYEDLLKGIADEMEKLDNELSTWAEDEIRIFPHSEFYENFWPGKPSLLEFTGPLTKDKAESILDGLKSGLEMLQSMGVSGFVAIYTPSEFSGGAMGGFYTTSGG